MGLFGGLSKTWSDGYQIGDFTKSLLYDLNPIAWAGESLYHNIAGDDDFDFFENNPNWTPSSEDPIDKGLVNTWYKYTGQAHLTDEYKHEEELANSVNQRTALDMQAAGLSKFGMSGTSAGSPSASNGLTLLDSIGKAQQIRAQALSIKEQKYNYNVSRKLGIRTGDKNMFAPLIALAKGLFGIDVDDIPEEGLIPYFVNYLKDGLAASDGDGSTAGAVADAVGSAMVDSAKASSVASPYSLVELPKVPFDPSKGIMKLGSSEKSVPTPADVAKSDTLDLQNTALRIHHDALYDELGGYAVGQAKPLSVQSFYDKYVGELMKEGFDKSHAMGIVSSWIKKMMDDLGYTYDKNDKMWFYDH